MRRPPELARCYPRQPLVITPTGGFEAASDLHLRKKYGLPIDTVQTLRERLMTHGATSPWSAAT